MKTVRHILGVKGSAVYTIAPEASVREALERLAEKDVGALVVTGSDGRIVGMLSERDYARKVALLDRMSRDTPVRDIMTQEVICVAPEQTVETCMALMTRKRFRHLPVVVDGRLAGLVSIGDVVKALMDEQQFAIQQLEHYIMGGVGGR
jgi:CBS domain-containing protein